MKLTNKQLKSIIKQELNNILKEMRYPGGHPDQELLRKVRREDAGIPPAVLEKIKNLEEADPMAAKELAVALGSQEYLEKMPDDPKNIMQLKNDIVDLQVELQSTILKGPGISRGLTKKLLKKIEMLHAALKIPMPDPYSGEQDEGDKVRPRTRFHRTYSGDHGPLKVFSPGKMGTRLRESNENFSPTFEKIKTLMVAGHEGYNQANELFNQIKGSGMMDPSEEELLQKVANYVGVKYKDEKLRKEQRSLMDFDGHFYQLPNKVDDMKRFREIGKERKELRKEILATEKELGYDAFGYSIRRNLKGDYGVLQGKGT